MIDFLSKMVYIMCVRLHKTHTMAERQKEAI